ncbi:hypothetical protein ACVOMT_11065 [Sphingomonas panni]
MPTMIATVIATRDPPAHLGRQRDRDQPAGQRDRKDRFVGIATDIGHRPVALTLLGDAERDRGDEEEQRREIGRHQRACHARRRDVLCAAHGAEDDEHQIGELRHLLDHLHRHMIDEGAERDDRHQRIDRQHPHQPQIAQTDHRQPDRDDQDRYHGVDAQPRGDLRRGVGGIGVHHEPQPHRADHEPPGRRADADERDDERHQQQEGRGYQTVERDRPFRHGHRRVHGIPHCRGQAPARMRIRLAFRRQPFDTQHIIYAEPRYTARRKGQVVRPGLVSGVSRHVRIARNGGTRFGAARDRRTGRGVRPQTVETQALALGPDLAVPAG